MWIYNNSHLCHYGVLGMKWGKRKAPPEKHTLRDRWRQYGVDNVKRNAEDHLNKNQDSVKELKRMLKTKDYSNHDLNPQLSDDDGFQAHPIKTINRNLKQQMREGEEWTKLNKALMDVPYGDIKQAKQVYIDIAGKIFDRDY